MRVFLVLGITAALRSLVMSLPIIWLVNQVFAISAIHAIFGVEQTRNMERLQTPKRTKPYK